ncbi:outer membrane protein assembly factor BamD [Elstera cyanobacteriorum]|uniref:outer membrane protein assembly factor BamD n=1 Tax=Elstera cyanobacteriorum TaxID=2022747 RepID=UPI0023551581|nr:outer membrane protein assembly factor BamD [Elstera cyanobacteriorum]MCK6442816.1 outer membrane protein assembly factor BamD [Elstera cyanobacteriorum]
MRRLFLPALLLLPLAVAGCASSSDEDPNVYVEAPVEQLYNQAMDAMLAERYDQAGKQFDEVERQHPYSVWATKAQLMSGYTHYLRDQFDDAIIAMDRFIQLHPSHRDTPYAYYIKAISYYAQIADVSRDQSLTEQAMGALNEVVRRYPDSSYARDARVKIDLTRDHMAGKEMEIGRFYLRTEQYTAAVNRFRRVVDQYQTTTHVPEALLRLTEIYLALGLKDEAQAAAAVLGHNYPGSRWYAESYALMTGGKRPMTQGEPGRGWFGRQIESITDIF